jgi:hemoglobin
MRRKPPICPVAIHNLVIAFYTRVRRDHILAPVFARAVGTSDAAWTAHVAQTEDCWSSLMLGGREPKPSLARARLPALEPALFERWLSLYGSTCGDLFEPEIAVALQSHATRIAASLMSPAGRPKA